VQTRSRALLSAYLYEGRRSASPRARALAHESASTAREVADCSPATVSRRESGRTRRWPASRHPKACRFLAGRPARGVGAQPADVMRGALDARGASSRPEIVRSSRGKQVMRPRAALKLDPGVGGEATRVGRARWAQRRTRWGDQVVLERARIDTRWRTRRRTWSSSRGGVHLKGASRGRDRYEQHAECSRRSRRVRRSAAAVLDQHAPGGRGEGRRAPRPVKRWCRLGEDGRGETG